MRTASIARVSLLSVFATTCAAVASQLAHLSIALPLHELRVAWTVTRLLVQL